MWHQQASGEFKLSFAAATSCGGIEVAGFVLHPAVHEDGDETIPWFENQVMYVSRRGGIGRSHSAHTANSAPCTG